MANTNTSDGAGSRPFHVVIFGGSGAQGSPVVEALAASNRYAVSILTRNPSDQKFVALRETYPKLTLITGSYTTESGLRAAFEGQDGCYFNLDSFSISEPAEYFWTFRAYEIAVQSGLKHFIYAGAGDRFGSQQFHMAERYRNSHNIVASRLSSWLATQPIARLPWTILTGGVYAEMLYSLLQPRINPANGMADFIAPMNADSVIPLIPVGNYGKAVKWALETPERSVGAYINAGAFFTSFPEIAKAFSNVTGKPAQFVPCSTEQWMEGVKAAGINPEAKLPRGAAVEDETAFTFRKSFGAWWALWKDDGRVGFIEDRAEAFADEVVGLDRARSVEDWMRRTGYDGGAKRVMKGGDGTKDR